LHHAYLFTGTRGVGKTTLARIFAKALNCRQGLSSQPCEDDIAQAIDEGRFVDLIEIDAASKTKVEDTRELLDNVQYAPSVGRYKIYLIDEVHMLSTHSFNALLKTLEEPPEHVKFLLATTDPHKLPVTVLSRCLQFHLRPMQPHTLIAHLSRVLTAEQIAFDDAAIALIANMAQGSVRDALSLVDQAIVLGAGRVGYDSTRDMLGLAAQSQIIALLQAIAQQDKTQALAQLQQWVAWGADFDRLQQQLLTQLHELAMMQVFPSLAEGVLVELHALLTEVSAEQVQIWLQVALLAKQDMQIAPSAQMGFEIMIMRLLHFRASEGQTQQKQQTPQRPAQAHLARVTAPMITTAPPTQTLPPTPAPIAATPAPTKAIAEDFSLLLDMIDNAQKKTPEPPKPSIQPTSPPTLSPTPAVTQAIQPTPPITQEPTASVPEMESMVEMVETATLTPYPPDVWRDQLAQWRLNDMHKGTAERCVRLMSADPQHILLACPPEEAESSAIMRDKLAQAISRVQPNSSVIWHNGWQAGWLTPQQAQHVASEQEIASAQQNIMQDQMFTHTCQSLGLSANWTQLSRRSTDNTD
jgi:DNA polymerase-3 subunit gamma/tau